MYFAKTTARRDEKHLSLGVWCNLYYRFDDKSSHLGVPLIYTNWENGQPNSPNQLCGSLHANFRRQAELGQWSDESCDKLLPFMCETGESWWRHQMEIFSALLAQWRGALVFSLICVCINGWANNREAGVLICHCAHYDVTVMVATARHQKYRHTDSIIITENSVVTMKKTLLSLAQWRYRRLL